MIKGINIKNLSRLLMVLLSAMFMLSACTTNNSHDADRTAISGNEDTAALEAEHVECWQTAIVSGLYQLMSETTIKAYNQITQGATAFMMVCFAIWFAFRILAHVSSVVEENPAEVWTEVTRKLFICIACGIIAQSPPILFWILNITVFPIYNAFLEFGSELLARASDNTYTLSSEINFTAEHASYAAGIGIMPGLAVAGSNAAFGTDISMPGSNMVLFNTTIDWWTSGQPIVCKVDKLTAVTAESGFPDAPKNMMECLICSVNQRLNLGFSLAFEVMSAPGFMATIIGLLVLVCFTFVKLGFVFYLVDTIFKFAIMIIILPLLILGYPFEYTKGWLGKAIAQILNSAAFMMFVAIVIAMTMMAIEELIMKNPDIFNPTDGSVKEAFTEFSIPFMCLMMICFLITSSIGVAQQVTDSLVGGNSKSEFNKKIVVVASMIGAWLTGGASKVVQKIAFVKKAQGKFNNMKGKMNRLAGRD